MLSFSYDRMKGHQTMLLNDTTYSPKGQHLSIEERVIISELLITNHSFRAIGRALGRPHTTISYEVKRGMLKQVRIYNGTIEYYEKYDPLYAQERYDSNREKSRKPYKLSSVEPFISFATDKILKEKWSPDTVVGYALKQKLFNCDSLVSAKTLYNYIDLGLIDITNTDLLLKLRRKPKLKRNLKNKRILGQSIDLRPTHIDDRKEFGHWEIDTVIGVKDKTEPVLLTLTERLSRFELILKIDGKTEEAVSDAITSIMDTDYADKIFKSITSDNGSEFASLETAVLKTVEIYYTHPYSSWERGTNENHNGIIRRFIPKGKRISEVLSSNVKRINIWMNNLPRKILNYQTPYEVFMQQV